MQSLITNRGSHLAALDARSPSQTSFARRVTGRVYCICITVCANMLTASEAQIKNAQDKISDSFVRLSTELSSQCKPSRFFFALISGDPENARIFCNLRKFKNNHPSLRPNRNRRMRSQFKQSRLKKTFRIKPVR